MRIQTHVYWDRTQESISSTCLGKRMEGSTQHSNNFSGTHIIVPLKTGQVQNINGLLLKEQEGLQLTFSLDHINTLSNIKGRTEL